MDNNSSLNQEALFLNTRLFEFPQNGLTMYFTDVDNKDIALSPLTSYYPVGIEQCFPNIQRGQTIYTSFTRPIDGFRPLVIDFSDPNNFFLVKRYYNHEIKHYFRKCGILVDETFIKDTDVYIYSQTETHDNYEFHVFNRFNIKVNFNQIYKKPELVISYGRTMMVMKETLGNFMQQYSIAHQEDSIYAPFPMDLINKTLEVIPTNDPKRPRLRIVHIKHFLEQNNENKRKGLSATNLNYQEHHAIVNRSLKTYFHIDTNKGTNSFKSINRYTRFVPLIEQFINQYLDTDAFRRIIPISKTFTPVTAGAINPNAMELSFGKNTINKIPQRGLNNGPYLQPNYANIWLFFIFPNNELDIALHIYDCFRNGYGRDYSRFEGLNKYIGVPFQTRGKFSIPYDVSNPDLLTYLQAELDKKGDLLSDPDTLFICMYLSPYNKRIEDAEKREQYYRVKELLLRYNIISQAVDIKKYKQRMQEDQRNNRFNLSYTLQNMAVAINAKLGGQPWIISVPQKREFVIGVGAFKTADSKTPYIGAAFVFNNTGAFNKYTYFQKNSLSILIGAIQEEICNYRRTFDNPSRIIIHYYKVMREDEALRIEEMLQNLKLDIPFYVITINETESEDIFVFDRSCNELIPRSGRYVNLGNNTYLLCNNTRYGNEAPRSADGYPFPIKIRLSCRGIEMISQHDIEHFIEQIHQFSRIYWKSVRQQNLPVTILYPKMIAEIMPHFDHQGVTHNIPADRLWFL